MRCMRDGRRSEREEGVVCMSTETLLFKRGMTETKMRIDITREQMGSTRFQPNCQMRMEEIMTLTLPRASAKMCKKMP